MALATVTQESAVRMAFATVTGATIEIVSAFIAIVVTFVRTRRVGPVGGSILIALMVLVLATGKIQSGG